MRRCRAWIGLILLLLIAFAAAAPTASAGTSTAELRAKLRKSRTALRDSRARLARVRADLAAARQLVVLYADTPFENVIEDVVGDEAPLTVVAAETVIADETADADVTDATVDAGDGSLADPSATELDPLLPVVAPTAEEIERLERRVTRVRASVRGWRERVEELARRVRRRERIATWNRRGEWRPLIELAARRYGVNAAALYRMMKYESGGRRYAGTTYKGLFQYAPSTWRASWNPWRGASIYNGWAQIRATAYAISRGSGPHMWPSTYSRAF